MKLSAICAAVSLSLLGTVAQAAVCTDKTFGPSSFDSSATLSVSSFCFGSVDSDKAFSSTFLFSTTTSFKIDGILPLFQNVDLGGLTLSGINGTALPTTDLNAYFNTHQYGDPDAEIRLPSAGAFGQGSYALTFELNGSAYAPGSSMMRGFSGEVFITAVPEPETYAMMLAGLGAIGFMARRRIQG